MLRINAVLVALAFACAASAACAGDFVPRATNGYGAVGDDPGARSAGADMGAAAPMSEAESPGPARVASAPVGAGHVGVEGAQAAEAHAPAATDGDEKSAAPATPHKPHALRWQSLLPGVMK